MAEKGDKAHVIVEKGVGEKATREDEIWEVVSIGEGEQGKRQLKVKQGSRATNATMEEEKWDEMVSKGQGLVKASEIKDPDPAPAAEATSPAPTSMAAAPTMTPSEPPKAP